MLSNHPMSLKYSSSQQQQQQQQILYLRDDCWESIVRFIINDRCCLNSLSLVSKQLLSITNRLLSSLTVVDKNATHPILSSLFKRFTNLNSLDLSLLDNCDLNNLLRVISDFPLKKLTSLNISNQYNFPKDGLQAFSKTITTLTSLTFTGSYSCFHNNHLLLIADCFPLLKHLDLTANYFLNDQHVAELSLLLADLVSVNLSSCSRLTKSALFTLVENCPSLSEIKMECSSFGRKSNGYSDSLVEFGVYPQLKSLYLGESLWLSDEIIIMFASTFPNLQLLSLHRCHHISKGICEVLRRCGKIRHLNLAGCPRVKLRGINFVIPQLEVLNLSYTKVDDETLYVISKNCCGLLKLLLKNCKRVTKKGVKHVVENCTQLREHGCLLEF